MDTLSVVCCLDWLALHISHLRCIANHSFYGVQNHRVYHSDASLQLISILIKDIFLYIVRSEEISIRHTVNHGFARYRVKPVTVDHLDQLKA